MLDRKKVLHELEHQVADADWCDNDWKDNVPIWMLRDVLALLREQEPVEPTKQHIEKPKVDLWYCGECGKWIGKTFAYCPWCGKKVERGG